MTVVVCLLTIIFKSPPNLSCCRAEQAQMALSNLPVIFNFLCSQIKQENSCKGKSYSGILFFEHQVMWTESKISTGTHIHTHIHQQPHVGELVFLACSKFISPFFFKETPFGYVVLCTFTEKQVPFCSVFILPGMHEQTFSLIPTWEQTPLHIEKFSSDLAENLYIL